jgi:hypothetical protein
MHDMNRSATSAPTSNAGTVATLDGDRPGTLYVRPWPDPVLDRHGHDPRDTYTERFWLPLLGPSAVLLARQLADRFDRHPDGFAVTAEEAARSLGLGAPAGRRSAFHRTIERLAQFHVVHLDGADGLLARRRLPGLSRTQVGRLPATVQEAHEAWRVAERATPALPAMRERSRRLALSLLQLGETPTEVAHHLHRLRFHPSLTQEALAWAEERFRPPPPDAA